ncbi:unnamed protein product [Rhizophagus irregularis]|nr:unnamed protein product [Rhizophagus irregularis]
MTFLKIYLIILIYLTIHAKNFSHDVILDYDVPHKNLNENLSDCNENQFNQDYETSDNEDELVEFADSLELIAGLTFNSWDEFKSWINRFALKEL